MEARNEWVIVSLKKLSGEKRIILNFVQHYLTLYLCQDKIQNQVILGRIRPKCVRL